jgi:hypothetical protein
MSERKGQGLFIFHGVGKYASRPLPRRLTSSPHSLIAPMSAASRAEARRQAILSRGTDRLAKLTTSARGENAPAYMHDGV